MYKQTYMDHVCNLTSNSIIWYTLWISMSCHFFCFCCCFFVYILFRKFATLQRVAEERTGDHIYKLHYHMQPLSSGIAEDSEDSTIPIAAQCLVKLFLKRYSLFFMEGTGSVFCYRKVASRSTSLFVSMSWLVARLS